MILGLILVTITVLPFLWERVLGDYMIKVGNIRFTDLILIGLLPCLMTWVVFLVSDSTWTFEVNIFAGCLLILFSTFSWGCCLIFRNKMKTWFWVVMTLLTIIQLPLIVVWAVFADSSGFDIQF